MESDRVVARLLTQRAWTAKELASQTGYAVPTIWGALARLDRAGRVNKIPVGRGKGTPLRYTHV